MKSKQPFYPKKDYRSDGIGDTDIWLVIDSSTKKPILDPSDNGYCGYWYSYNEGTAFEHAAKLSIDVNFENIILS